MSRWKLGGRVRDDYFFYEVTSLPGLGDTILRYQSYAPELVGDDVEDWKQDALCAQTDPDAFFPEDGNLTLAAKAVCARCDVAAQCLQYALDNRIDHGVFGGVSAMQRIRMRRGAA